MKKKNGILLGILILLLSSCSKNAGQEKSGDNAQKKERLENFIFEVNMNAVLGKSESKYYMPDALKAFVGRKYLTKSHVYFMAEEPFPSKYGIIDASDFYDASADDAAWVDSCIIRLEEERIAAQLEAMEALLEEGEAVDDADVNIADLAEGEHGEASDGSDGSVGEGDDAASGENAASNEDVSIIPEGPSTDGTIKNNHLSFSEFDREKFIVQEKNGKKILIYAADGSVLRRFYDENYRLDKEEYWYIKSAENAEIKKTLDYEYDGQGKLAVKKITENGMLDIYKYTDSGLVSKKDSFYVLEDKNIISSSVARTYNEKKDVLSEIFITYTYTDNTYEKLKYSTEQKYIYTYNEEDIPPDFKYYEDGSLKMHNKYSGEKGRFTSQIFFDERYSVKTYYEDNMRVREVFFLDGAVRREKYYEKQKSE